MIHTPRRMTSEEREDLIHMLVADLRGASSDLAVLLNIPTDKTFIEESGTDIYILEERAHNQHNKEYPYRQWLSINKTVWED